MIKTIKECNIDELKEIVSGLDMPVYRYKQLLEWLYVHNIDDYSQAKNLPKPLIEELRENYPIFKPEIIDVQTSKDGTKKYLLKLYDGSLVETVGIPSSNKTSGSSNNMHLTVCFSTQVGCPMGCAFCATGKEKYVRNLGMGEIIDQIHLVRDNFNCRVSNIVAMGQGEPFLNTKSTLDALNILNNKRFDDIGSRRITLSTCGIPEGINTLANDPHQYTLAISLHSAIQHTRNIIMPKVSKYNLAQLHSCIENYISKTNRRVTFEYLLIKDLNDDQEHLNKLVKYCKPLLSHVNILQLNPVNSVGYKPSSIECLKKWESQLNNSGIETTIRNSKGADISGACGQLKNTYSEQP